MKVPAGTFSCTRIRYQHREDKGQAFEVWWSPVAGRVKELVYENGTVVRTIELAEHRAGNAKIDAKCATAAATIDAWCEANLGRRVEWTWIVPSPSRIQPTSRFALIPSGEGYQALRIHGDQAHRFRWSNVDAIHRWLADEGWFDHKGTPRYPGLATAIAVLLARCHAETTGRFLMEPHKKTVSAGAGTIGAEVYCDMKRFDGEHTADSVRLKIELTDQGKVSELLTR